MSTSGLTGWSEVDACSESIGEGRITNIQVRVHFYVVRLHETVNPGSSAHNVDPTHLGGRFFQGQVPAHVDMTPRNDLQTKKSEKPIHLPVG